MFMYTIYSYIPHTEVLHKPSLNVVSICYFEGCSTLHKIQDPFIMQRCCVNFVYYAMCVECVNQDLVCVCSVTPKLLISN